MPVVGLWLERELAQWVHRTMGALTMELHQSLAKTRHIEIEAYKIICS